MLPGMTSDLQKGWTAWREDSERSRQLATSAVGAGERNGCPRAKNCHLPHLNVWSRSLPAPPTAILLTQQSITRQGRQLTAARGPGATMPSTAPTAQQPQRAEAGAPAAPTSCPRTRAVQGCPPLGEQEILEQHSRPACSCSPLSPKHRGHSREAEVAPSSRLRV